MRPDEYHRIFALEGAHWWYAGLRELLLAALPPLPPGSRLLDAGCGTGRILAALPAAVFAIGLDLSPVALGLCKRRSLRRLTRASADRLPFRNARLDCILSLDVLYHRWIQNDLAALEEYRRILKPGGRLFLHLPAYPFLHSGHDRAIYTARRYTAAELARKLAAAGLAVQCLTYRNTLLFPAVLSVRLLRRASEASDLRPLPPRLNALCLALLRLENRLIRRGIRLPFGSSLFCIAVKPGVSS